MEKKKAKLVRQADRISYSRGSKIAYGNSGPKAYCSDDVHVSYSTDVAEGETLAEAFKRASKQVERWHRKKVEKLES